MRKIAQPYCVWWDHSTTDSEISQWCRDNLHSHYNFLAWNNVASFMEVTPDKVESKQINNTTMLCMFECPRDALLFKLTWVGQ